MNFANISAFSLVTLFDHEDEQALTASEGKAFILMTLLDHEDTQAMNSSVFCAFMLNSLFDYEDHYDFELFHSTYE